MRIVLFFVAGISLVGAFNAPMVEACVICIPYSETTQADVLIDNKSIVFAKENTEKPYTFHCVEVLKGAIECDGFEAFINTTAKRMLSMNTEDVVVFGQMSSWGKWRYIAYADIEYQAFIREIVKQADGWQEINASNRIDFFAERLTSSNPLIREQAYLEVGRAPYSSIKRIAGTIPRRQIREFLANWRFIEWHNLYILMLGQSLHPDDRAYIREKLENTAKYHLKGNLSAWVTAFIESHPDTGLEEIETLYFSNQDRTREELEAVLMGLSVLASEEGIRLNAEIVDRRHRIVKCYATLLENHPMMAGPVASDLMLWEIRALVEQLSNIRANHSTLEPLSKLMVTFYLSEASRFPAIEEAH